MTTEELFEAAQLDALGLLDEREQAEFEAAFQAAAPGIRAQLRDEQSRFASPDRFRLNVEPSADLRGRVLAAVKAEIAGVAGSVRARLHGAGRELPTVHPVRRVSPAWRVATLACATAVVVLSVLVTQQKAQMAGLALATSGDQTINKLIDMFGPSDLTAAVFDSDTKKMPLSAVASDFKGEAAIWYNAKTQSGRLFCRNIAPASNETIRLVAVDDNGKVTSEIAEFASSGELITRTVSMSGFNPKQLAIYVAARGLKASEGHLVMVSASV